MMRRLSLFELRWTAGDGLSKGSARLLQCFWRMKSADGLGC